MSTTVTAIVVAVLAGLACFYSWSSNKGLSIILALVCGVASIIGIFGAFFWALGLFFKLLPILLLLGAVFMLYKLFTNKDDADASVKR